MKKNNTTNHKNKPVILQILPSLKSGGVERGTVEVVKALSEAGFEPIVVSSGGNMVNQVTAAGGLHIQLPVASKNPFIMWRNIKKIIKLIHQYDVDIIHARSRAPAWSAYFACKKTGCHFVTTFHGVYSIGHSLKRLYNSVMVKGEKVIAISEYVKNHIQKNYKKDDNDIVVIHRGADLDQFDHDKVPKSRVIQKAELLKIDYDKQIILLPGRISNIKGHEFLLEALTKLPKSAYMCLFVGDINKHKSYLKVVNKKIKDLGLSENVRIIENQVDMPALYSLVDIVVSPSIWPEAFGRVAIEAQAMERLVVATNHGGTCETVIDEKTGWLVEPNDVEALADVLNKLLAISEAKRKSVTGAAKKHIKTNFSLATMTKKTLNVYREILGEKVEVEPEKEKVKEVKIEKSPAAKAKQPKKEVKKPAKKTAVKASVKAVKKPEAKPKKAVAKPKNKQLELIG
jgi:glycosyltransferase involved in cell wall biosynthesis